MPSDKERMYIQHTLEEGDETERFDGQEFIDERDKTTSQPACVSEDRGTRG